MRTKRPSKTKVFRRLCKEWKAKAVILEGGKRASKTYSIASWILLYLLQYENKRASCFRKTLPAFKASALETLKEIAMKWGIYKSVYLNPKVSDRTWEFPQTGSKLYYGGIDDIDKKQGTESNIIWLNEGRDFSRDDVSVLDMTLSAPTNEKWQPNKMFVDYNPFGYIPMWIDDLIKKDTTAFIHCTFEDNDFAQADYIEKLKAYEGVDDYYYQTLVLGNRAEMKGAIYSNVNKIEDCDWPALCDFDDWCYGADEGFAPDPNVLVFVGLIGKELYVQELVCETGMTDPAFVSECKKQILRYGLDLRREVYPDPSQPGTIQLMNDSGLRAIPACDNSVELGIKCVQSYACVNVCHSSITAIEQLKGYKNKQDRAGNVLPIPVKENDHIPDAVRYAVLNRWGFCDEINRSVAYESIAVGRNAGERV